MPSRSCSRCSLTSTSTRAALLLIESDLGFPPRGAQAALLGERLLIASLLIVVLCLLAVRLTPPLGRGAQP